MKIYTSNTKLGCFYAARILDLDELKLAELTAPIKSILNVDAFSLPKRKFEISEHKEKKRRLSAR